MKNMQIVIPVAVVLVGIVVGTLAQGQQTERWKTLDKSAMLIAMTEHIENTPIEVGEWKGEVIKVTNAMEQQYERAHAVGHIEIRFRHTRTNKTVQVSLVCGPRRHIGVHTPDKCYVAAGFKMHGNPKQAHVIWNGGKATTLGTEFVKESTSGLERLKIVWCWGATGEWIAPSFSILSRMGLGSSPAWYKLYVSTPVPANARAADIKENKVFMREFMPLLNQVLFPHR